MKRLILILLAALLASACTIDRAPVPQDGDRYTAVYLEGPGSTRRLLLYDVTIGGESHQYLHVQGGGLSHWESCRYCKSNTKDIRP